MSNNSKPSKASFLLPSVIGIILFMIPVQKAFFGGKGEDAHDWTIIVKILADFISGIIGDFLPGAVSMVSDESRVVISLGWQVVNERPVFVILGRGDDDSYNLLDLETAEVVSVSKIQLAARVIAAGVKYL